MREKADKEEELMALANKGKKKDDHH